MSEGKDESSIVKFTEKIVVTSNDFRFIVTDQLSQLGVSDANIIVEPTARNTGPAVVAASFFIKSET